MPFRLRLYKCRAYSLVKTRIPFSTASVCFGCAVHVRGWCFGTAGTSHIFVSVRGSERVLASAAPVRASTQLSTSLALNLLATLEVLQAALLIRGVRQSPQDQRHPPHVQAQRFRMQASRALQSAGWKASVEDRQTSYLLTRQGPAISRPGCSPTCLYTATMLQSGQEWRAPHVRTRQQTVALAHSALRGHRPWQQLR